MDSRRTFLLICLIAAGGCHSPGGSGALPQYSGVNADEALVVLRARAAAIHTFTAQCELTLDRGDGQSVRLDGVIVMAPPDRVRLRAWKLGQAVFDLTLRPDGLWIEIPPEAAKHSQIVPATIDAAKFSRHLTWITGGFFTGSDVEREAKTADGDLVFGRDMHDGTTAVCEVDPGTITVRRFRLLDGAGRTRFALELTGFRDFGGIIWPTHLTAAASGAAGESAGRIDVICNDIEFNGELAAQAFDPPPSAKRQP